MSIPTEQIQALCFDYGNTLIELGSRQVAHQYSALGDKLQELFGDFEQETFERDPRPTGSGSIQQRIPRE